MFPVPRRRFDAELLDDPDDRMEQGELDGTLADLRLVNRRLGGVSASLGHLSELSEAILGRSTATPGPLEVLDVASGSADIPVEMVRWARRRGINIRVTALDVSRKIIKHARKQAAGYPEIGFVVADGLDLPFADNTFDIVHCSLALHHFREDGARTLLSEIARTARGGYIVCDLRRSWVAYALIFILTRFMTKNRMTRNDGPVSVLRSFTKHELSALAGQAGLRGYSVREHPFWRMALVWRGV